MTALDELERYLKAKGFTFIWRYHGTDRLPVIEVLHDADGEDVKWLAAMGNDGKLTVVGDLLDPEGTGDSDGMSQEFTFASDIVKLLASQLPSSAIDELEQYLGENGFPFTRELSRQGRDMIVVDDGKGYEKWLATLQQNGLLEVVGELIDPEERDESVEANLTVQDVIAKIEAQK